MGDGCHWCSYDWGLYTRTRDLPNNLVQEKIFA
jgi:hypothetical protein